MSHYEGEITVFRKELVNAQFKIDEKDNSWRIYQDGQPFYTFHPSAKGIRPCKDWIFKNYKIDLRNKPKKNLTKREQRANMGSRIQELEQRMKLTKERFDDLVFWLKRHHYEIYDHYMERYE